jgi:hypothetical protein
MHELPTTHSALVGFDRDAVLARAWRCGWGLLRRSLRACDRCGPPPDFHIQLLAELIQVNLDDRWIVIVGSGVTARGARRTHASSSTS